MSDKSKIISHNESLLSLEQSVEMIRNRIINEGDKPYVTVEKQLELLNGLKDFEFGKFLVQHQGINGFWTHYMLTHPWFGKKTGRNLEGKPLAELEKFLLNHAPTLLATQQRFEIFLKENQKCVKNGATLVCIPSGLMGEFLYLDFKGINDIKLVGIDLDNESLTETEKLAQKQKLDQFIKLENKNAWHLNYENEFDLISSNGLNIYEPDEKRLIQLYQEFYKALKPNGKLVTSFVTCPPNPDNPSQCQWDFSQINKENLLLQKIIFSDILNAKWQCFRSENETKEQLKKAGFKNIEFIYDRAKIFPTVVAFK